MAKKPKTVHLDEDVIAQIEALNFSGSFGKDRGFSYVVNEVLREGIASRSIPEAEKARDD